MTPLLFHNGWSGQSVGQCKGKITQHLVSLPTYVRCVQKFAKANPGPAHPAECHLSRNRSRFGAPNTPALCIRRLCVTGRVPVQLAEWSWSRARSRQSKKTTQNCAI